MCLKGYTFVLLLRKTRSQLTARGPSWFAQLQLAGNNCSHGCVPVNTTLIYSNMTHNSCWLEIIQGTYRVPTNTATSLYSCARRTMSDTSTRPDHRRWANKSNYCSQKSTPPWLLQVCRYVCKCIYICIIYIYIHIHTKIILSNTYSMCTNVLVSIKLYHVDKTDIKREWQFDLLREK